MVLNSPFTKTLPQMSITWMFLSPVGGIPCSPVVASQSSGRMEGFSTQGGDWSSLQFLQKIDFSPMKKLRGAENFGVGVSITD